MTDLLLCPTTTASTEAQYYVVIWPHNHTFSILWRMWCSSRRWAIQDTAQDFLPFLNEMFGENEWQVHWLAPKTRQEIVDRCATMNLRQTYDWARLVACRRKYNLPPWSREPDQYKELK